MIVSSGGFPIVGVGLGSGLVYLGGSMFSGAYLGTGMIFASGVCGTGFISPNVIEEPPEVKTRLEKLAAAKSQKEKDLIKALIQNPKDANIRGVLHDLLFESGREKEAREVLYRKW